MAVKSDYRSGLGVAVAIALLTAAAGMFQVPELTLESSAAQPAQQGAKPNDSVTKSGETREVVDRDRAVSKAIEYVGGGCGAANVREVSRVTMTEDATPFLGATLVGKSRWKVVFHDVLFKFGADRTRFTMPMVVTVDVCAETERLICISAKYAGAKRALPPRAVGQSAEQQMIENGDERWHGLVASKVDVSFAKILSVIDAEGQSVSPAQEIVGYRVLWSRLSRSPIVAWSVEVRCPPAENDEAEPEGQIGPWRGKPITIWRHIVIESTKTWVMRTNRPIAEAQLVKPALTPTGKDTPESK